MEYPEKEMVLKLNSVYRELNDLYHDIALQLGISDSAFTIFYAIFRIGDGCLQRDICKQSYTNKQTINSTIQRLKAVSYTHLDVYKRQGQRSTPFSSLCPKTFGSAVTTRT